MGRVDVEVGRGELQSHSPHPHAHFHDTLRLTCELTAPSRPAEALAMVA